MTSTKEVQRITADEAVAALTAAAWTESISEERYEAAVEAVLKLCGEPEEDRDPYVPASQIRAAVRGELGTPRTLIHCFMGGMGADWDLDGAVALARKDGAQCAWAPNLMRHELAVYAGGSMHRFDARRPVTAPETSTEGE